MKLHCNRKNIHYKGPDAREGITITNYSCDVDDESAARLALLVPRLFSLKAFPTRERRVDPLEETPKEAPEETPEEGSE